MTENETPRRGRGRPPGTGSGETPQRRLRMGPLWDQGAQLAAREGITMTAFVERALRREITRVERQSASG